MTKLCFEVLNEAFCRDAEAFSEPSEKDLEWQNKMTTTEWVKIFSKFTIWAIFFAVEICHQIESYLKKTLQAALNYAHNVWGGQTWQAPIWNDHYFCQIKKIWN